MSDHRPRSLGAAVQRELLIRVVLCTAALATLLGLVSERVFRAQLEAEVVEEIRLAGQILAQSIGDDLRAQANLTPSELHRIITTHDSWRTDLGARGHHLSAALRTVEGGTVFEFIDRQTLSERDRRSLALAWERRTAQPRPPSAEWIRLAQGRAVLITEPIGDQGGAPLGQLEMTFWVDPDETAQMKRASWRAALIAAGITILTAIGIHPLVARLVQRLTRLSERLLASHFEALGVLGGAIAKRDSDTSEHNFRVTLYALRLAEAMGKDAAFQRHLFKGAFLHDVGKIAIPDGILLKPGRLTEEEFEQMKTHVSHGVDILKRSGWLGEGIDVVRHHHEKFDGSGYMDRLRGEEIPLAARIFAVADVFDALTSRRPYKEPMPLERAMAIIGEGRGMHFDPMVVDTFEPMAERMLREIGTLDEIGLREAVIRESRRLFSAAQVERE